MYANKNIDFHSYVINIHSFGFKLTCDLQAQVVPMCCNERSRFEINHKMKSFLGKAISKIF
jgi:hypothetical protein